MQAAQEKDPHENEPSIAPEYGQRSHRILIVDDEPTLRFGFGVALSTEGFEVEEAEDGDSAIRAITENDDEHGFDAMVLDLRMPGKSGIDVMRALTEQGIIVPTIIVSAYIDSPTAVEAIEWGAVDFLQKPTKPNELRGIVSDLIAEESDCRESKSAAGPSNLDITDTIARVRWHLRRRSLNKASELLDQVDENELPSDSQGRLQFTLWRMIVSHLRQREELGGKTEFASSRFYAATDLLKYLAYTCE